MEFTFVTFACACGLVELDQPWELGPRGRPGRVHGQDRRAGAVPAPCSGRGEVTNSRGTSKPLLRASGVLGLKIDVNYAITLPAKCNASTEVSTGTNK